MTHEERKVPESQRQPASQRLRRLVAADSDTVFRVVTHQGDKQGFKLEGIFWRFIQLAAAAEKKRVGAYVASVLEGHADKPNKSSVLRMHATEWLSSRLADTVEKALSPQAFARAVQAAPVPCFTMGPDDRISSQNDLFVALLRTLIAQSTAEGDAAVHIRFHTDIKAIRELLTDAQRPFVDDVLRIQYHGCNIDKRVRVTNIYSLKGTSRGFLVFVLD